MNKKLKQTWNKVFETDLHTLSMEMEKNITTPALIILEGPLGAGKTTFVKQFCAQSSSPTYSVLTEHDDILHGDFYRLEGPEDIIHLELSLYLEDKNYFLLEWGAKFYEEIKEEIDESFHHYLLEISVDTTNQSRKFELFEIS